MSSLQHFNYNGQVIQRRESDGYINLTQMCHANGKRLNDWHRLKSTKSYIEAVSSDTQIPASQLLIIKKGNSDEFTQGTWGHPMLAIHLAQWINPKFYSWCNAHVFNLMEFGSTSLNVDPIEEMNLKIELTRLEVQKAQAEAQKETAIAQSQSLRYTITQTCPESVQQKVLGYQQIEKIEYRDRVIQNEDVIRDGSTINKTDLCYRYGILTKNGKPNYKRLNQLLSQLPEEAWDEQYSILTNKEIKREYLGKLDQLFQEADQRNLFLGE